MVKLFLFSLAGPNDLLSTLRNSFDLGFLSLQFLVSLLHHGPCRDVAKGSFSSPKVEILHVASLKAFAFRYSKGMVCTSQGLVKDRGDGCAIAKGRGEHVEMSPDLLRSGVVLRFILVATLTVMNMLVRNWVFSSPNCLSGDWWISSDRAPQVGILVEVISVIASVEKDGGVHGRCKICQTCPGQRSNCWWPKCRTNWSMSWIWFPCLSGWNVVGSRLKI